MRKIMPETVCHACGASDRRTENINGHQYCASCSYDLFYECDQCGDSYSNEKISYCDGHALCDTCAIELGFIRCEVCEVWEQKENTAVTADGRMCVSCADEQGYKICHGCNALIVAGNRCVNGPDNHPYCGDCIDNLLGVCADCGRWTLNADLYDTDAGRYCYRCERMPDFDRKNELSCSVADELGSLRFFGVELETHRCNRYLELESDDYWGAKCDPTVRGKEFDSAKMQGDDGLAAIRRLCEHAKEYNWQVSDSCGYHLHADMTEMKAKDMRAIAYAYKRTMGIWEIMVADRRGSGGWCEFKSMSDKRIASMTTKAKWKSYSRDCERYRFLNWCAYDQYGSLELRHHEGTVDSETVCNWVKANLSFIDWAVEVGCTKVKETLTGGLDKQFDALCAIWVEANHEDLIEFYFNKCDHMELENCEYVGAMV